MNISDYSPEALENLWNYVDSFFVKKEVPMRERRRSKYYRRYHRNYLRSKGNGRAYVKKWMRRYRTARSYDDE